MKWNKWWTIGSVVVILAGAYGGYRWWSGKEVKPLQAALQTTQVRKGTLEVKISGTGNIETANRESLTASSGTIAAVKVKEGDLVKKGQVLATFEQDDSTSVDNQIQSKQLDLKKKRLDLESLQTQYKEAADDDQRAQLSVSIQKQQLDIETTQSDIQTLQDDKSESGLDPITAPIDGTLATFGIKAGDTIGGQSGNSTSSLGEVVDYNHLQMVVGVDELDISKVKLNQKAVVLVEALPDQTFAGKVTAIAQEGTTSNGVSTFDVTVTLDDITNLKAGMSAEASITTEQKADALYLPIEAVQSFGQRYFVMVPDTTGSAASGTAAQGQTNGTSAKAGYGSTGNGQSGAAGQTGTGQSRNGQTGNAARQSRQLAASTQSGVKRVQVQVGIHNEDFIEIVTGLKEGDSVVVPTTATSSTQNRNGAVGIPGIGIGGAGGIPGGGFQGGNGGTRSFGTRGTQGGGTRG